MFNGGTKLSGRIQIVYRRSLTTPGRRMNSRKFIRSADGVGELEARVWAYWTGSDPSDKGELGVVWSMLRSVLARDHSVEVAVRPVLLQEVKEGEF